MSKEGVINIHGQEYTLVAQRLADFRKKYPEWSITTEMVSSSDRGVLFKTSIANEGGRIIATGHAQERFSSKGINATSAIENCETSSVGRALALIGFGGHQIASAEEVTKALEGQKKIDANHRLMAHMQSVRVLWDSVHAIKAGIAEGRLDYAAEAWAELTSEEKRSLWVAPTKGGVFTTKEREILKSNDFNAAMKEAHSE